MRAWQPRAPVVLLVDDDPDILTLLGMLMESEGCVVRTTPTPIEALTMLSDVDVVVVDQRLPTMTGTELIASARAQGYAARFLVISGHPDAKRDADHAGAEGFLAKPIEVRPLMNEVERLFLRAPGARSQG